MCELVHLTIDDLEMKNLDFDNETFSQNLNKN